MQTSAAVRRQIEESLSHRIASPLTTRERHEPERLACGVEELDGLLQGGLPVGVVTELAGPVCSGRTTLTLAYLAAVTRAGNVCAWIDVADALDPESVAANGVDLERLLWVRCGGAGTPAAQPVTPAVQQAPSAAVAPAHPGLPVRGGGSPHPRAEGRDMPEAISAMLSQHGGLYNRQMQKARDERRIIGTPGAPNRPLERRPIEREEQVASDRVPSRRQQQNFAARCAEAMPKSLSDRPADTRIARLLATPSIAAAQPARMPTRPWDALDQALKVADLLLQAGGFSVIVLDLGNTAPEHALRIPLATWFRFRAACERTQVSMVLLTQQPCARSSAELVLRLEQGSMIAEGKVMTGIRFRAAAERGRKPAEKLVSIRKPPQSERGHRREQGIWSSRTAWAQSA